MDFGHIFRILHLYNYFNIHVFPSLRWRWPSSDGPSRCPIAHFRVSSCSEIQKPSQTTTEQGKVDLCILDSRTTWRGNGMLLEATVCLIFWNSDHVVLKLSTRSLACPCSVVVWLGFLNSDYVVLKLSVRSSALPYSRAVWLAFWNSDHVDLKSSKCYLGFASAVAVPLGSEGDPGCLFFPLTTYQATFISDILLYDCRNWKCDGTWRDGRKDRQTWRLK